MPNQDTPQDKANPNPASTPPKEPGEIGWPATADRPLAPGEIPVSDAYPDEKVTDSALVNEPFGTGAIADSLEEAGIPGPAGSPVTANVDSSALEHLEPTKTDDKTNKKSSKG